MPPERKKTISKEVPLNEEELASLAAAISGNMPPWWISRAEKWGMPMTILVVLLVSVIMPMTNSFVETNKSISASYKLIAEAVAQLQKEQSTTSEWLRQINASSERQETILKRIDERVK
jgi:isoleucyl-tRNA synthetase